MESLSRYKLLNSAESQSSTTRRIIRRMSRAKIDCVLEIYKYFCYVNVFQDSGELGLVTVKEKQSMRPAREDHPLALSFH